MNWIQNFLHFFIKEVEVEVEVEEVDIHTGKLESASHVHAERTGKEPIPAPMNRALGSTALPPLGEKQAILPILEREGSNELFHRFGFNEAGKDIEARITYQYPKGRFHSLSIPKEIASRRSKPRSSSRKKGHSVKTIAVQNENPEREQTIPKAKEAPVLKSKPKQPQKAVKTQDYRVKGPFKPTEIPSPVFGFNRPLDPKKETEVIEHEISHFLKEDLITPAASEPAAEKLPAVSTDVQDLQEPRTVPMAIQERQEPRTVPMAIQERQEPRMVPMAIQERQEPRAVPMAIQERQEPKAVPPAMQERQESMAVSPAIQERQKPAAFPSIAMVEQGDIPENEAVPIEAVDIHGPAPEQEIIRQDDETPQPPPETITVIEEAVREEEEGILEPDAGIPDEAPKPGRRHLPFNVMMLKQDKKRWEENKRGREHPSRPKIPSLFQEIANMDSRSKQLDRGEPVTEVKSAPAADAPMKVEPTYMEGVYQFPHSSLLHPPVVETEDSGWIEEQKELLNETLQNFNVGASVVNVTQGPAVTRFEVQPEPGVKVNKITNLTDDIKLSLAARDIRMEAPIPGKHAIGIEVPNQKSRPVLINEIIQSRTFLESPSPLTAILGLDISGNPIVTDLKKMPHGLIAGATGSGKSVCINSILVSLLFKANPLDLKLLLIDPKMVELAPYNRIPHLVSPVITDVKAATASLKWAVEEMERRYELFAHTGVRDINRFNELAMEHKRYSDKLPFIVIVIDELADLMMMSPADVEEAICRIAQKARACGIHLIVATQRPSVDVITGLIKANIPTRIAFSVSSQVDSRTIIDVSGAEKLLGRGDMLFLENGASKPVRLQGTFVSDDEIDLVVAHVREQQEPEYLFQQEELLKKAQVSEEEDELFYEACEFIIDQGGASTSSLQRRFKIGYNRAARLMDLLENQGYISGAKGSKPREVLITEADLENMQETV